MEGVNSKPIQSRTTGLMKKSFITLTAATQLAIFPAAGIESPSYVSGEKGDTVSAARVTYSVRLSEFRKFEELVIGIDDTLNTFRASLADQAAGLPFVSGPAVAQARVEVTDTGDGIREIRIVHQGRVGLTAPEAFEENDTISPAFASYNQLSFAPYRISGNQAPVPLTVDCDVTGCILDDPEDSESGVELGLFVGHYITNFSGGMTVNQAGGQIELESRYNAPNHEPAFIFDLMGNGSSTALGNGRYRVNANYKESLVTGYLNKLDLVSQHGGSMFCQGFNGNDTVPWEVDSTTGNVTFTIKSTDPTVRFFIHEKENPAPAPDLQIGRRSEVLRGAEVLENRPSRKQKTRIPQNRKRKATFCLRLVNLGPDVCGGNEDSSIRLKGPRRRKSLKLAYFEVTDAGLKNVTSEVATGRYVLPGHFSGYGEDFKVQSTRKKRGSRGNRKIARVNFTASNPAGGGRDATQAMILTR